MKTERLEQLLWERLDGTISNDDLNELEAVLVEHPEPHELEREIARLAEKLDDLDTIPPPAELRTRIDRALANAKKPKHSPQAAAHPGTSPAWQRRWLPLAASLVIGVAIGYLVHPGAGTQVDGPRAAGAMYSATATADAPAFEIDLGSGVGTITTNATGSEVEIDAILTGGNRVEVALRAADGDLRLLETKQIHKQSSELKVADAGFFFQADGPGSHYFVLDASETTSVRVLVWVDDALVVDRVIALETKAEGP